MQHLSHRRDQKKRKTIESAVPSSPPPPLALSCLTRQARDSLAQMTRPSPRVTRRKVAKFTLFSPSKPSAAPPRPAQGRVRSRHPSNIYIHIYSFVHGNVSVPSIQAHAAREVANPSPVSHARAFRRRSFYPPPFHPSLLFSPTRFFPRRNISTGEIPAESFGTRTVFSQVDAYATERLSLSLSLSLSLGLSSISITRFVALC